jgi:hypothetical protein
MKSMWTKINLLFAAATLVGTMGALQATAQQTTASASGQATASSNVPPQGTIAKRDENQQDRIAQGVKSGQLTAGETANLETKEANLNHEVRQDRKQNGGNLTDNEKRQINRQQNKLSRNIYRDKHNGRTQHGK